MRLFYVIMFSEIFARCRHFSLITLIAASCCRYVIDFQYYAAIVTRTAIDIYYDAAILMPALISLRLRHAAMPLCVAAML